MSEKVKVKLRYNMAGPAGHFKAGSIVEFPVDVARKLVEGKGGELVETTAPVTPPSVAARPAPAKGRVQRAEAPPATDNAQSPDGKESEKK